ncbi:MAG TPA: hypothetical protein PLN85_00800 [archaeon]|nr:hypothetical protein [archaeon]
MKRKISEQAYYDRLKELAEVKKTSTNENKGGNLGTLIDYKRSSDGVAFGIVKENHKYYIKKGGLKENLDVSDFVYISGLGNIKQYQYNSLAEADKNRNMLLNTINETTSLKFNEDKISDEIEQAEKKLDDANVAANEPIEEPTDDENIDEPLDDENIEEPSDDEPLDDENIEEPSDDESLDDENIEEPTGDEDDKKDSIKSDIGKIGNKIQQTSLTDSQVKSYVNMFLGYFKEYFLKMEQSLLNDMAKKINALQKEKNIDDLQKDVISEPTQDIENITENNLNNSGFINYAESMGYDKDSLLECNVEEMSNLISGYANSCEDGEYDDDHKTVALFLKLMPKVIDVLKNEYGCDEYINKLEPEMKSLEDTSDVELQEALGGAIWGGLKTIGKGITDPIKDKAKKVGTAINKGIENVKQGAAAQSRKQDIRRGTKKRNAYLDKVQEKAKELIELIQQANAGAAKAGQEPIKVASLLSTIRNQISSKNSYVDLSQYKMENSSEMTNTEVLPDVDNKISESEKKLRNYIRKRLEEISGLRKVSINESKKSSKLKKLDKLIESQYNFYKKKITVDNKISESEKFLRNYIRKRLEEISGLRKVNINESKKSSKLKKLDKLIESQYNLYLDLKKKNIEENYNIDEIFGKSKKEIFYKLDPNDENAILDFFKKVFSEEFNTPYSGAFKNALNLTPREKRYNILKQYFDNNQKGTIARNNQTGELVYTLKSPLIKGNSLSGKGFNAGY